MKIKADEIGLVARLPARRQSPLCANTNPVIGRGHSVEVYNGYTIVAPHNAGSKRGAATADVLLAHGALRMDAKNRMR